MREAAPAPMTAAINSGDRSSRFKEPAKGRIGGSDGVFPEIGARVPLPAKLSRPQLFQFL
jgi:hypothetical protein